MSAIKVRRAVHFESASLAEAAQVTDIAYASKDKPILLESVTLGKHGIVRRSEDNGRMWKTVEESVSQEPLEDWLVMERSLPNVFCDPENGRALRISWTHQQQPGVIAWDYERALGPRTIRLFVQTSRDEGRTWSQRQPLIAQGGTYDEIHWLPGVYYGKNGAVISGAMIKGKRGEVLVPCYGAKLFEGGDIINRKAPKETSNPDGAVEWVSSTLFGKWRADGGLDWTMGGPLRLPLKYSCDGADEPCFDYLPDGRLFVALRARTYPHTGQELPGLHYYALSSDEARSWSEPKPLLYSDGSFAYSPACMVIAFRSTKNGRFYLITNFADVPPVNCDPRTKLQIAELDTQTFRIKKESVTIIEQQDKAAGQPDTVRFSNFRCYEDRDTGDVALFMTPSLGDAGPGPGNRMPPHAYRYDIQLPA